MKWPEPASYQLFDGTNCGNVLVIRGRVVHTTCDAFKRFLGRKFDAVPLEFKAGSYNDGCQSEQSEEKHADTGRPN
jgi:hypothetical protein